MNSKMENMRILHQNRKKTQWIGGDVIQMEKTMDALTDLNVYVSFNDQPLFTPALLLSMYDIAHLWNFSMPWTKFQVWAAKKHGLKIVCSMIYHETEAFIPYDQQQIMIDACDALIFLTEKEVDRARRHLTIPDEKIHIIPNGIDEFWLKEKKQITDEQGYILTVGRLDGSKGQLETAMACKRLGVPYFAVGEVLDVNYAAQCMTNGAKLLAPRPQKDLIPLYDNAALFVLASSTEIFPLSVMEAGARGLNSVVTTTCEWKNIPNVEWCEYKNVDSIAEAIDKGLKKKKNTKFKKKLSTMKWEDVGKSVLEVYNKIYGSRA